VPVGSRVQENPTPTHAVRLDLKWREGVTPPANAQKIEKIAKLS
jgi:hypothetical protein